LRQPPAAPRRLLALALTLFALVAVCACGAKKDVLTPGQPKPFTLMLDFFPNADHAAIYEAIAHGDFRAAGLNVTPQAPSDPSAPLKLLAAGRVDMAISYEPEVMLARDRGLKVVSVGALVQRPLTSVIALGSSHISKVAQLAGKKVGTAGIPYQSAELKTVLQAAGVASSAVQEVNVGFNLIPAMLSGKVSATLGGFWNYEGIQLQLARRRPVVIPVDQAGVPTYDELVLVVREDEARSRGQDIRGFLQALTRGEQAVRSDPAGAVSLVLAANRDLDKRLQLASIQRTLPAALPADHSKPFGYQDPNAWIAFARWMFSHGLLTRSPDSLRQPYTNEFLPGQGV
jgi:putative hydroxymethylpyrimidine transport system substrate-binding protein